MLYIQEQFRRLRNFDHLVGWNVYLDGKYVDYISFDFADTYQEAREVAEGRIDQYRSKLAEPTEQTDPRQEAWQ